MQSSRPFSSLICWNRIISHAFPVPAYMPSSRPFHVNVNSIGPLLKTLFLQQIQVSTWTWSLLGLKLNKGKCHALCNCITICKWKFRFNLPLPFQFQFKFIQIRFHSNFKCSFAAQWSQHFFQRDKNPIQDFKIKLDPNPFLLASPHSRINGDILSRNHTGFRAEEEHDRVRDLIRGQGPRVNGPPNHGRGRLGKLQSHLGSNAGWANLQLLAMQFHF